MKFRVTNPKITTSHLSKLAIIYIRRSSMYQVLNHGASGDYQRSFDQLARSYGWEDDLIKKIDLDDGKSGTDITKRKGLQWVRQQVFEGRVGALICWDASRLGRDHSDFAQLVKLCGVYNTLIIDEKGVYDPNNTNDLMSLNIMGAFNHTESRRTGEKSSATKRMKAEKGELLLCSPTGYVHDKKGRLILDPRNKVQKSIRLFFDKFEEYGSANKVVKYFNRNKIKFPTLKRIRGKKSKVVWGELRHDRALDILHNLTYTGIYSYGRMKRTNDMPSPNATEQMKKIVRVDIDSDEVVIRHGAHEGYITLDKFKENQKILKANYFGPGNNSMGAAREGSALLSRIVVCGSCLRKLRTHYSGRCSSGNYICESRVKGFGGYACVSITARRLDEIVIDEFFKAVNPAQLQLTLRQLEEVDKEQNADVPIEEKELKRAKGELKRLELQFDRIDPLNTLVHKLYQKKLQEKLIEVERLEKKCAKKLTTPRRDLTKDDLRALLALPRDISTFWKSPAVTNSERKQFLRYLISQVTIKKREKSKHHDVIIQWRAGVSTLLTIFSDGRFLQPEAVELMRKLAPDHTITQIIDRLHEAGFRPTRGYEKFSQDSLRFVLKSRGIKLGCPEMSYGSHKPRGDGRYPARAVAKMVGVSLPTIYSWCNLGIIDCVRKGWNCPFWIKITREQVAALKSEASPKIGKFSAKKKAVR